MFLNGKGTVDTKKDGETDTEKSSTLIESWAPALCLSVCAKNNTGCAGRQDTGHIIPDSNHNKWVILFLFPFLVCRYLDLAISGIYTGNH